MYLCRLYRFDRCVFHFGTEPVRPVSVAFASFLHCFGDDFCRRLAIDAHSLDFPKRIRPDGFRNEFSGFRVDRPCSVDVRGRRRSISTRGLIGTPFLDGMNVFGGGVVLVNNNGQDEIASLIIFRRKPVHFF